MIQLPNSPCKLHEKHGTICMHARIGTRSHAVSSSMKYRPTHSPQARPGVIKMLWLLETSSTRTTPATHSHYTSVVQNEEKKCIGRCRRMGKDLVEIDVYCLSLE